MIVHKTECVIGGRTLSIEVGRMARQASGSCLVRLGDTVVFGAVTFAEMREGFDFFPLTVDYREKTYAAGKFPGGFIKREGRPTNKETLTMRLIDRPLRPLFPDGVNKDVSVQTMVLSFDQQNDPDILAMISASAALSVSEVPFLGPIGSVRVALIEEQLVLMPTLEEQKKSDLDLVVSGTKDALMMVECGAKEVSEETMLKALSSAHEFIREVVALQESLVRLCGKTKLELEPPEDVSELRGRLRRDYRERLRTAILIEGKHTRKAAIDAIKEEALAAICPPVEPPALPPLGQPEPKKVKGLFEELSSLAERELIVEGVRADRRGYKDIRPITIEVGLLPRTHGSALFTRGETQALVVATLGTGRDEQIVDGLSEEYSEKFMLHYNFPSFSVGEAWPNRGPKRREIGHGALARRALEAVVPPPDKFPYTCRLVSDIMESNGSSSMASVCGGTLALMDAGVKIRQPVAGIAMGLIKEGEKVCILSDILGSEDHNGDMDFKVAGTQRGITALQMDIKIAGISESIMRVALEQAREGRIHILREMLKALDRPREEISPFAPKIVRMTVDPEKIGIIIGPGGKMIKKIQEETGSTIEIEDDGTVIIWGESLVSARGAQERIEALTEEVKPGRVYKGRVVSIKDFGCFVEVLPGQEGLVHVSELGHGFVQKVGDVVTIGDTITVKCLGIDSQGRIKLSKKAAEKEPQA